MARHELAIIFALTALALGIVWLTSNSRVVYVEPTVYTTPAAPRITFDPGLPTYPPLPEPSPS